MIGFLKPAIQNNPVCRIRVALLTDADAFAGTERHILDLALALRDQGCQPSIGCPSHSPLASYAAENGVQTIHIPERHVPLWLAVWRIKGLMDENRIDILHAHNGRTCLIAALALSFSNRGRFVVTQHFLKPARMSRGGLRAQLPRWSTDGSAAGPARPSRFRRRFK